MFLFQRLIPFQSIKLKKTLNFFKLHFSGFIANIFYIASNERGIGSNIDIKKLPRQFKISCMRQQSEQRESQAPQASINKLAFYLAKQFR